MPETYSAPAGQYGSGNYGDFVSQEEVDRLDQLDIDSVEPTSEAPAGRFDPYGDDMTFSVGNNPWDTLPSPFVPPPHMSGNPDVQPVPQRFISPHELYMLDNPRSPMGYDYPGQQQNQVWGNLNRDEDAPTPAPTQQPAPMYQPPMYQPPAMMPYQGGTAYGSPYSNPYSNMMQPMTPFFPGAGMYSPGAYTSPYTSPYMMPGLGVPGPQMMNSIAPFLY